LLLPEARPIKVFPFCVVVEKPALSPTKVLPLLPAAKLPPALQPTEVLVLLPPPAAPHPLEVPPGLPLKIVCPFMLKEPAATAIKAAATFMFNFVFMGYGFLFCAQDFPAYKARLEHLYV
jgi:hypothetical protein